MQGPCKHSEPLNVTGIECEFDSILPASGLQRRDRTGRAMVSEGPMTSLKLENYFHLPS